MFCDRCGNEIGSDASVCPFCQTPTTGEVRYTQPSAYQGQGQFLPNDFSKFGGPPLYQTGYRPVSPTMPPPVYHPLQTLEYTPQSYPPYYQGHIVVTQSPSSDGPLIAEILFSLFGVFGVGWLIGGETTTGIILLLCSIFVYWPVMILGTLFTFGLGLVCLGPLAIGVIILNTLLCNNRLKRRATRSIIIQSTPPSPVPMPPQSQRPQ